MHRHLQVAGYRVDGFRKLRRLQVRTEVSYVIFSAIALLAGVGFVLFRQPVYAALSFATAVLAAAGLYILQDAAYVAAATMVIYAGATIIIFLFVLMFAQHSHLQAYELKYSNLGVAMFASLCLFALLAFAVSTRSAIVANGQGPFDNSMARSTIGSSSAVSAQQTGAADVTSDRTSTAPAPGDTSVAALGNITYTRYLWSVELAGTLLLIAAGGAIIIAQREPHAVQSTGVSR
jgi:NADH-quinone oxidoreductase subunit J